MHFTDSLSKTYRKFSKNLEIFLAMYFLLIYHKTGLYMIFHRFSENFLRTCNNFPKNFRHVHVGYIVKHQGGCCPGSQGKRKVVEMVREKQGI